MTSLQSYQTQVTTSASGAMHSHQARRPIIAGLIIASLGTSGTYAYPTNTGLHLQRESGQTTGGSTTTIAAPTAGVSIGELRRLSGLTWDQLARLFNVTRRSLHFWASGKSMTQANYEHLQRVLRVIQQVDLGSANANRKMLLSLTADGKLPFDMLVIRDYERVLSVLGRREERRISPDKRSIAALAARAPQSPAAMVDALQTSIHLESGTARAARSVRSRIAT